ncbi:MULTISPECIES: PadR family transcriptional regulator [Gammaproteobacteria]|uniref:PadR family transcriptional regulator n=1 Tax=Gammaproteobacteria TaxID=1236 RepID=UPI000DD0C3D3|nr:MULTISPECIES: PadR family transcriptional regulator [Gammaproteobacteria]RTE85498.1 PadR family transcriptional regulator [Aliidiomarina sp. B3213]TCZ89467.1 PadR family transcriptional regulator [Lysobacter sp. N42]
MVNNEENTEKWDVQLRKGSLELVVLAALKDRNVYGLELLKSLHQFESMQLTEGTLYPLLDRLKRDELVAANWVQEGESRPRKYYQLTQKGLDKLTGFTQRWRQSVSDIEFIINNPGPAALTKQGEETC